MVLQQLFMPEYEHIFWAYGHITIQIRGFFGPYVPVFSPTRDNDNQKRLRTWTLFTQCSLDRAQTGQAGRQEGKTPLQKYFYRSVFFPFYIIKL